MELKRFKDYFVVGSGMVFLGIVLLAVFEQASGMFFVLFGLMLIFIGIYWARKSKTEILSDERYMRINEKAGFNAFWTTIGILAVSVYVDFYFPLDMNFRDFFTIVFGVGLFSFNLYRFYYDKMGFK